MNPSLYDTARQLFSAELVMNIFPNNSFLLRSRDWGSNTMGKVVNYAEAGAIPDVIRNNDGSPIGVTRRVDVNNFFALDEFQTVPIMVDFTEEILVNFSKRQDVMSANMMSTNNDIARTMMYRWLSGVPAGNIIRTSGDDRTATAAGATGTRKKITIADIVNAGKVMNAQDVPDDGGRCMLISAEQWADLQMIDHFWDMAKNPNNATLATGAITKIMGFDVYVRSTTVVANNASTPVMQLYKADSTKNLRAGAASDNNVTMFWHDKFTTRAASPSASKVNIVPTHGGDEFSVTALAGGRAYHSDFRGVVALVEAVGA